MCELWVRTQNKKKLLKIDKIYYEDIEVALDEYGAVDHDYDITTDDETLGTYSTEKRALEVLDEIQKLLTQDIILTIPDNKIKDNNRLDLKALQRAFDATAIVGVSNNFQYIPRENIVYEMPEE